MRKIVILAALFLAGCNLVLTEAPLLHDAVGGPRLHLKPGQWVMRDQDCETFDTALPPEQWPSCASLVTVLGDSIAGQEHSAAEHPIPFVLADGAPALLQARLDSGDIHGFVYAGAEITARDAGGLATGLRPVQCGPPAPNFEVQAGHYGSHSPGPGLTMAGDNCGAADIGAVRAAAIATQQRTSGASTMEWRGPASPQPAR